ncbi:MAG: GNAT family N-acetyltransferase, partial [Actinomycetota bacterium]
MELRPARPDDLDAIAALVPSPGPSWWAERIDPRAALPLVVVGIDPSASASDSDSGRGRGSDSEVRGVVAVEIDGDQGRIQQLAITPAHRRTGQGRKLLLCAERILARAGCATASIDLDQPIGAPDPDPASEDGTSAEAAAFLTAMGWTEAGHGGRWQIALDGDGAQRSYVLANRWNWDEEAAAYEEPGRRALRAEAMASPTWGCWGAPESEVGMLRNVAGADVVELGCGTG